MLHLYVTISHTGMLYKNMSVFNTGLVYCISSFAFQCEIQIIGTSSTIYAKRCIHSDELVSRNAAVGPSENNSLNKCDNTIVIYLLLHFQHMLRDIKWYFTHEKQISIEYCSQCFPFSGLQGTEQRPGTFKLVTQPKEIFKLCKHRVHAPLMLAEKLRRDQSTINERSSFKFRDLLHDRSNSKVQGSFQVYINMCNIRIILLFSPCYNLDVIQQRAFIVFLVWIALQ